MRNSTEFGRAGLHCLKYRPCGHWRRMEKVEKDLQVLGVTD